MPRVLEQTFDPQASVEYWERAVQQATSSPACSPAASISGHCVFHCSSPLPNSTHLFAHLSSLPPLLMYSSPRVLLVFVCEPGTRQLRSGSGGGQLVSTGKRMMVIVMMMHAGGGHLLLAEGQEATGRYGAECYRLGTKPIPPSCARRRNAGVCPLKAGVAHHYSYRKTMS